MYKVLVAGISSFSNYMLHQFFKENGELIMEHITKHSFALSFLKELLDSPSIQPICIGYLLDICINTMPVQIISRINS